MTTSCIVVRCGSGGLKRWQLQTRDRTNVILPVLHLSLPTAWQHLIIHSKSLSYTLALPCPISKFITIKFSKTLALFLFKLNLKIRYGLDEGDLHLRMREHLPSASQTEMTIQHDEKERRRAIQQWCLLRRCLDLSSRQRQTTDRLDQRQCFLVYWFQEREKYEVTDGLDECPSVLVCFLNIKI